MSDLNAAAILLSAAGAIILILVGVVGFFMKSFLKAIDDLKLTVGELKLVVELQKQDAKSFNKLCDLKHSVIEKRLDEIENCKE
jgi:hypothetical protein